MLGQRSNQSNYSFQPGPLSFIFLSRWIFDTVSLSRHGIESFNSWMDGQPQMSIKCDGSASTGDVALVGDAGLIFPNATGTGYSTCGTTTHNGVEIGISNQDQGAAQGTFQLCEMTLHDTAIADGSTADNQMMAYFRQKWKAPGQTISNDNQHKQAELSAGAVSECSLYR